MCFSIFYIEGVFLFCICDVIFLFLILEFIRLLLGDFKLVILWLLVFFFCFLIEYGVDELFFCNFFMWVMLDFFVVGVVCNSGVCKEVRELFNVVLEFFRVELLNFMVVVMIYVRKVYLFGMSVSVIWIRE